MPAKIAVSGGAMKPEDKYGKVVIAGRAQTGKTSLAKRLSDETGLIILKTCTTRPKRHPDEDTYHFYDISEAMRIPPEQKLFPTTAVDGFERWTNKSDFLDAGIAVLDPTAVQDAVRLWQSQGYRVAIIYCGLPDEERKARWMKDMAKDDGSDWYEVLEGFQHREHTEKPMFDQLEAMIRQIEDLGDTDALLYPNAAPEHRTVCNEDMLLTYRPLDILRQDVIVRNFMARLAAGGLPGRTDGYRSFPSNVNMVLHQEDWTWSQWTTLCQAFDLLPERTRQIMIAKPLVKALISDACADDCSPDQKGE